MTGVIWFVQVVHYPSFYQINDAKYHTINQQKTSLIVVPVMVLELVFSIIVTVQGSGNYLEISQFLLLVVIWLSTFFWQVPHHKALAKEIHTASISKLVYTNWLRTFAWTGRVIILAYLTLTS
jgi:hypothetical protein